MQLFTLRSSCRTVYFISTIITGLTVSSTCPSLLIRSLSHHLVDAVTLSRLLSYISTSHLVLRLPLYGRNFAHWVLLYRLLWRPGPSGGCSLRGWDPSLPRVFIVDLNGNVGFEPLLYSPSVACYHYTTFPVIPTGAYSLSTKGCRISTKGGNQYAESYLLLTS